MSQEIVMPFQLPFKSLVGQAHSEDTPAPLSGSTWYSAAGSGDGLAYAFPAGSGRCSSSGRVCTAAARNGWRSGLHRLFPDERAYLGICPGDRRRACCSTPQPASAAKHWQTFCNVYIQTTAPSPPPGRWATFITIQEGTWTAMGTSTPLSPAAQDDLANFSEVMRVFTAVVYVNLCLAYLAQDLLLAKREGIAYNV